MLPENLTRPTFYGTRRFITAFTTARHLSLSSRSPRPCEVFCNVRFYGQELLLPRPTPKLEDHPLSAVRDSLLRIFEATFHFEGLCSVRDVRTRRAVVTGIHLSWLFVHHDRSVCFKKIRNYFERTDCLLVQTVSFNLERTVPS